mgnify:CR=1 FL=1
MALSVNMRHAALLLALNLGGIAVFTSPLGAKGLGYGLFFATCSLVFYLKRDEPPLLGARPGEKPVGLQKLGRPPPNIVSAYVFASVGIGLWVFISVLNLIWPGCKPMCA